MRISIALRPEPDVDLHSRRPAGTRAGAVLLGLLVVSACGGGSGPIQIGVAANFTDPLSLPIRYGAQLAAEEINAAGGVNGRPIELVEREDYADTDSAVVVATDFYNSQGRRRHRARILRPDAGRRAGVQRREHPPP